MSGWLVLWLAACARQPAPELPLVAAATAELHVSGPPIAGLMAVWADADVLWRELAEARPGAPAAELVVANPWRLPVHLTVDGAPIGRLAVGGRAVLSGLPAGSYAVRLTLPDGASTDLVVATAPTPAG